MGGGSSRALMQGNRWLFVGKNGARLSTQLHGAVERGIGGGWNLESRARMRLPALYRGRCMVRVHCLAYPVLRIGGPFVFRGSQGPGKAELRRFSSFIHGSPRSKRRRSIVVVPQAALAPFPHFSGSNNSSKRRLRRKCQLVPSQPQSSTCQRNLNLWKK
jgi:hypothetical protein